MQSPRTIPTWPDVRRGFRDFCATVRSLLAMAGANPRGVSDNALIEAWLAEELPECFAARFLTLTGQPVSPDT
jgi:hypothetical protein